MDMQDGDQRRDETGDYRLTFTSMTGLGLGDVSDKGEDETGATG